MNIKTSSVCNAGDWRADGYRWRQSGTAKNMKCGDGLLSKTYFKVRRIFYTNKILL